MKTVVTPFRFSGGKVVSTSDPITIARQKIVDYLLTSSTERFNLADYGGNLNAFVFEPIDDLLKADLKTDLIPGLNRYVSGVTIIDLEIDKDDLDPSLATVTVYYRLPLSPVRTFEFNIASELTEETPL